MKIHVAKYEPDRVGGGWSFARNFVKGMGGLIANTYEESDVYFIPSPSMVQREEVLKAKDDSKKIVLRIDNAVRNSRNRNTGMSRMKDFADWSDLVIYQSEWAKDYLKPFTGLYGEVILNGADLDIYRSGPNDPNLILYSRFNRDETKNYEVARYWFSRYAIDHPKAQLVIVGQFSEDLRAGNFDFYNNENYKYYGVLDTQAMAGLYRNCGALLYTYYNDACSNTLIEALVSGCDVVGDEYYLDTGGAPEIREKFIREGREYFSLKRMADEYIKAIEGVL